MMITPSKNFSHLWHLFVQNLPKIIGLIILALLYGHFGWSTWYFINKTDLTLDDTSCSGFGFYLILFSFINFGLACNYLGRFIFPFLSKNFWKPWIQFFRKIPYSHSIFLCIILIAIFGFVIYDSIDDPSRLIPLSGLLIYICIGFGISPYKTKIPWNTILSGVVAQFVLGLFMIRWKVGRNIFNCVGDKVNTFLHYAVNASAFIYGDFLVYNQAVFAFNALAAIYLMSFFVNVLYYYNIMQKIVLKLGLFLQWLLGTPICESVNSAGNIFLGMNESPFLLKPYLEHMTDSEIHSIMTSGFASVSGTVLAAYISFGADPAHLITSCVMSAPAALCFSKLIYPEVEEVIATEETIKEVKVDFDNVLDAAIKGAHDAAMIVIGIIANIIAFMSLIYFVNGVLAWLGGLVGYVDDVWSLEIIVGKILIPLAYTMGVEWDDCEKVGQLIGVKTIINEFVAFQKMQTMHLAPKSKVIATYCLCGFTNPGAMGIMISTLGAFIPKKKAVLNRLVFRAYIGGSFVCFMTACVAGLLTP